jgi:hypothetical protein
MMHPEMARAMMAARADDLRRANRPRSTTRSRPMQPRLRAAAGWLLIEVGLRLAFPHRGLRPATR